jgi:sec-independent protein translocase protein TatC
MRLPLKLRRSRTPQAAGGEMTVMEHLGELRRRIMVSLLAIVVGAIVVFGVAPDIIKWLSDPYCSALDVPDGECKLVYFGALDGFITRITVASYGGFILAFPVVITQVWRFVSPGLAPKERKYAIPFIISSVVLFALGVAVALITLPKALEFLLSVGGDGTTPLLEAKQYITFIMLMSAAFGVSFEFPIAIMLLLLAELVTTQRLRKSRRVAILLIIVFAAVITPSQDPFSLFFMALPMYVFYEAAIVLGRILKK